MHSYSNHLLVNLTYFLVFKLFPLIHCIYDHFIAIYRRSSIATACYIQDRARLPCFSILFFAIKTFLRSISSIISVLLTGSGRDQVIRWGVDLNLPTDCQVGLIYGQKWAISMHEFRRSSKGSSIKDVWLIQGGIMKNQTSIVISI